LHLPEAGELHRYASHKLDKMKISNEQIIAFSAFGIAIVFLFLYRIGIETFERINSQLIAILFIGIGSILLGTDCIKKARAGINKVHNWIWAPSFLIGGILIIVVSIFRFLLDCGILK
jgi:uncharacterized membrane protein